MAGSHLQYVLSVSVVLVCVGDKTAYARDCSYNFQVWRPDQDAVHKIQDLERQCINISMNFDLEVAKVREQLLIEKLSARNLTARVERELLQQKLDNAQLSIATKDVRLDMMKLRNDYATLWGTVGRIKNRRFAPDSASMRQLSLDQSTSVEEPDTTNLLRKLKNSVGDLKAEWVLIKRELNDQRTSTTELGFDVDDVKSDAIELKKVIDDVRTDTSAVKVKQERLDSIADKLMAGVTYIEDTLNARGVSVDVTAELPTRKAAAEMKAEIKELSSTIKTITEKNAAIEQQLEDIESERHQGPFADAWPAKSLDGGSDDGSSSTTYHHSAPPKDCDDVYRQGHTTSGVYQVQPDGAPFADNVYCEMRNGSGWMLLQRRLDGSLTFNRPWLEYKFGFGNPYGEFWLGNELIHLITHQRSYRLRVDVWDWEGARAHAQYDVFRVDSEPDLYKLHVGYYSGNAGDSLSYHDGMAFSTEDKDNDLHRRNCAVDNKGGWWFNSCYSSSLNGLYRKAWYAHDTDAFADGVVWFTWKESEFYSLKKVELKIAPVPG